MKHLYRVVSLGIIFWLMSLVWLDLNLILMWPLFIGVIVGMTLPYFFSHFLNQIYHRHSFEQVPQYVQPTRPMRLWSRPDPASGPTRPAAVLSPRQRASKPTHPMPIT